jgi:ABC-2 type transport system ATP-binding protein
VSRSSRRGRWLLLAVVVVVLAVAAGAAVWYHRRQATATATTVHTQDETISVVDGPALDQHVKLDATVYLPQHTPAPAILISPGFGDTKNSVADQARQFAERGFVALAYTPRGFGDSTGQIALNSPDYEVTDARQLVSWLAGRPEVLKDAPGDPRVGVTGGSYGGALSLMLAGTDKRVDAIAPVITYNDLSQALVPNAATTGTVGQGTPAPGAFGPDGVFKRGWAGDLFAAGFTAQGSAGACGKFIAQVCQAYEQIATTGRADAQTVALLRRDSPVSVTSHITVPTLLVQGEQDTLFGLDQADANARQITAAGGKVKMIWYAGGHDGGSPSDALNQRIGDWLAYQLTGVGTDPGTGFSYDVQGSVRASGDNGAEPTVHTVTAAGYPGLTGGATQRQSIPLTGAANQLVLSPAGGAPAAVSGFPGLSGTLSAVAGRLTTDIPGEYAEFDSQPVSGQLLIAGASTVQLRVSSVPGQPSAGQAVLFAKLYDVAPNGTRTLPGAGVAPIRITGLPADGTPKTVTVTLPGVVQPVQSGHFLQLVVSTTDSNYAGLTTPSVLSVQLAGDGIAVPVVPGATGSTPLPWPQIIAIAVIVLLCLLAGIWLAARRRRGPDTDPELTEIPLVLNGISKSYPGGIKAVADLSFRVEHGQVVGLLGPNGAGKTTALRILMGLVRPTAGEIRVFGQRVRPGAPVLSRIGSFVEGSGFLPHLSGMTNLKLYWKATGRPAEQARFAEALKIAGLGDAVNRKVGNYSQGMRQRLAIAQSMLGLPDLLVLDEPTNGLDPPQIRDMREVLRRYAASGRTVLVSSHLLAEVEQTCSHVVVMHLGKLVAAGEVDEIVTGGETSFRVDDAERAADVLRDLDGIASVSDVDDDVRVEGEVHARLNGVPRSAAIDALVHAGVAVDQVGPRGRLEDAFLQLVGGESR